MASEEGARAAREKKLEDLMVEWVLDVRRIYLSTFPTKAMDHWDVLMRRMQFAAETTRDPAAFHNSAMKGLALPSQSNSLSRVLVRLSQETQEDDVRRQWRAMVRSRTGLLIALARAAADEERAAREAAKKEKDNGSNDDSE